MPRGRGLRSVASAGSTRRQPRPYASSPLLQPSGLAVQGWTTGRPRWLALRTPVSFRDRLARETARCTIEWSVGGCDRLRCGGVCRVPVGRETPGSSCCASSVLGASPLGRPAVVRARRARRARVIEVPRARHRGRRPLRRLRVVVLRSPLPLRRAGRVAVSAPTGAHRCCPASICIRIPPARTRRGIVARDRGVRVGRRRTSQAGGRSHARVADGTADTHPLPSGFLRRLGPRHGRRPGERARQPSAAPRRRSGR